MWRLLLILPPALATLWGCRKMTGLHVRERRILLALLLAVVAIFFVIEVSLIMTGYYANNLTKCVRDITAVMIMPLIHTIFCYSMGITSDLKYLKALLWLSVIVAPEVIVTLMGPSGSEGIPMSTRYCYLHVHLTPTVSCNISLFAVVFMLQTFIELQRVTVLYRIFRNRNLFLSTQGRWLVWISGIIGMWIIISLLAPYEWLAQHHRMDVCIATYSALITGLVFLLIRVFDSSLVVDSQLNPVQFVDNEDLNLADAIRAAIERDQVYRNSSLRIEELASMVSSNRTYVARVCKLYFNMTFTELMNKHRVQHAKELLAADGTVRMETVALESGFSSASFFARVFKAHEGMTPTQWRAVQRNGAKPPVVASPMVPLHDGMTTEEAIGENTSSSGK